jgi:diacylglycerol kinase family enzyme
MKTAPPTWLVVNPASGSNSDESLAELEAAMTEAGRPPTRIVRVPDEPAPDRAALDEAGVTLLTLFTGDGTANRALTALYGWHGQILVLPGGTQNLLARSLHGERSAAEIAADFAAGRMRSVRRPSIRCSAGDALCEIVAGPGASWSDVRESMREFAIADIAATAREAIEKSAGGPMVTVVEPPLGKVDGYPAVRIYPDESGHHLLVDGYGADGILDYAKAGLALLKRDFREGPHEELGRHQAIVCRADEPIELMLDGERATGLTVERFEVSPCDLNFLASGDNHA